MTLVQREVIRRQHPYDFNEARIVGKASLGLVDVRKRIETLEVVCKMHNHFSVLNNDLLCCFVQNMLKEHPKNDYLMKVKAHL